MNLALLGPAAGEQSGGVAAHAVVLARALTSEGARVLPCFEERFAPWAAGRLAARFAGHGCRAAVVEYTPNLYGWANPFPFLLLSALRRRQIRSVVIFHEIFMPDYPSMAGRFLRRPVNRWRDARCLSLCDVPVVTFEARARGLEQRTGSRPEVVPVFSSLPEPGGVAPPITHLLGGFGLPHEDTQTGVLTAVIDEMPSARLLWVGRAPAGLRGSARVDITGYLPAPDAGRALRSARYFVLCDRRGLSCRKSSVMAAFQQGVPVIANGSTWTDSLFVHRTNVMLYDGTARGLVAAVNELEAAPELARAVAEGGRRLYRERLSAGCAAARILALCGEG